MKRRFMKSVKVKAGSPGSAFDYVYELPTDTTVFRIYATKGTIVRLMHALGTGCVLNPAPPLATEGVDILDVLIDGIRVGVIQFSAVADLRELRRVFQAAGINVSFAVAEDECVDTWQELTDTECLTLKAQLYDFVERRNRSSAAMDVRCLICSDDISLIMSDDKIVYAATGKLSPESVQNSLREGATLIWGTMV